jgi:hypothetical protein
MSQSYEEVMVFNGVAERTGNRFDRKTVRGQRGVCRSLTALGAIARRLGDGHYYLIAVAWPAEVEKVDLKRA